MALGAAGDTLPDDGELWDSPEPQGRPCPGCTHSLENSTQWELQLVPAHSLGAGLLPWNTNNSAAGTGTWLGSVDNGQGAA